MALKAAISVQPCLNQRVAAAPEDVSPNSICKLGISTSGRHWKVRSPFLGISTSFKQASFCEGQVRRRKGEVRVRAGASGGEDGSSLQKEKIAPLEPESAIGQFLLQLLESHPHLVSAAAEQQLEQLESRGGTAGETGASEGTSSGSDLVLYRRMADVRERERKRAIEEVIYALVVQKFIEGGMPMVPRLPFVSVGEGLGLPAGLMLQSVGKGGGREEKGLERVHSEEALEMVRDHLAMILGGKTTYGSDWQDERALVETTKLRMGQVYAASIMYGYFLKRVDQRFQLEKSIQLLPGFSFSDGDGGEEGVEGKGGDGEKGARSVEWDLGSEGEKTIDEEMGKLKAYIRSFDANTLQKTATVRSSESIRVVERHTEALFGKPEVEEQAEGATLVKDEGVHVSVRALRRLILEAVAFGSFLWDVETFVDNRCSIANS